MSTDTKLLFSFDDLSSKDKAVRQVQKEFKKLGNTIAQVDIPAQIKRQSGISYRLVNIVFTDNQTVQFRVKKTGDIFQVKINNKEIPLRNQDDQKAALKEISQALDKGRTAFQKKLQKAKVELPKGARTAAVKMEKVLAEKKQSLEDAVAEAENRLKEIKEETQKIKADSADKERQMKENPAKPAEHPEMTRIKEYVKANGMSDKVVFL